MRILISILLCGIVFLTSVKELTHVIVFTLNRDSITDLYCVNKDVPQLMCYGSCHYEKVIEEHRENEEKHSILLEPFKDIVLYFADHDQLILDSSIHCDRPTDFGYSPPLGCVFNADIFHPPNV